MSSRLIPRAAFVLINDQTDGMMSHLPAALHPVCGWPVVRFVAEALRRRGIDRITVVTPELGEELGRQLNAAVDRVGRIISFDSLAELVGEDLQRNEDVRPLLLLRAEAPLIDQAALSWLEATLKAGALVAELHEEGSGHNVAALATGVAQLHAVLSPSNDASKAGPASVGEIASRLTLAFSAAATTMGAAGLVVADRVDLARAEDVLYGRIADDHRRNGVTIRGAPRIEASVTIGMNATIEHGAALRGSTVIGSGARVDIGAILTDVSVAPRAIVKPYSVCQSAAVGEAAEVGPFSHLRPGSDIHADARIGTFVETKNVVVRRGAMANHLAFLGDGDVGERSNISAGTIFCNSDGVNKFRTEVGAGAFVGSACQLVAPVRIGDGAFVATGTTVTRDVPAQALAIGRAAQENKDAYAPKLRARFAAIAQKGQASERK